MEMIILVNVVEFRGIRPDRRRSNSWTLEVISGFDNLDDVQQWLDEYRVDEDTREYVIMRPTTRKAISRPDGRVHTTAGWRGMKNVYYRNY